MTPWWESAFLSEENMIAKRRCQQVIDFGGDDSRFATSVNCWEYLQIYQICVSNIRGERLERTACIWFIREHWVIVAFITWGWLLFLVSHTNVTLLKPQLALAQLEHPCWEEQDARPTMGLRIASIRDISLGGTNGATSIQSSGEILVSLNSIESTPLLLADVQDCLYSHLTCL